MEESSTPEAVPSTTDETARLNSVDATTGQPMAARVMARKGELEAILAGLSERDSDVRNDITFALATLEQLITGDLEDIPAVVVADMNRWLERNKHLGERTPTE